MNNANANLISIIKVAKPQYPDNSPYNPDEKYPEYPFVDQISKHKNYAYAGVRELLFQLGLDKGNFGSARWNPLGEKVKPGMTVVIKPNFVLSSHKEGKDAYSIITHPSVMRAVADYCWIALKGEGKITFADAPQYDCNWEELLSLTNLTEVCDFYNSFKGPVVEFNDLRNYWSKGKHFSSMIMNLPGDPRGSTIVNLGKKSSLYKLKDVRNLYGAVYNRQELIRHHTGEVQEYQISNTILKADVVISLPKLKVHKKVGVTLNAKGLVGINTNKNFLVHYTLNTPRKGGDQFPEGYLTKMESLLIRIERLMYDHLLAPRKKSLEYIHRSIYWLHANSIKKIGIKVKPEKRLLDAGNWYGNDSAWRMVIDLMKVFYFADKNGVLKETPQRTVFTVIDGIIGGENKGPLTPDPNYSGVLIGGSNLFAADIIATRLMGYNPFKLKMYSEMIKDKDFNGLVCELNEIEITGNCPDLLDCNINSKKTYLKYEPYPGWLGHIEI